MAQTTRASKEKLRISWGKRWLAALYNYLAASIVSRAHRVSYTEEKVDRPFYFGDGIPPAPTVIKKQHDYVKYDLIWDAPANSSLDFGRLAVTWIGILAVAGVALYLN